MLNCTELKTWIFCHQFHFYGRPPKNLHPFNSRFLNCPANYGCSHGLKGHMGVFSANRDISARVKLLHYLDIAPFPSCPSPWVWVSSSGNPEASPSDLWISYLTLLMPNVYSWKGEGKLIINRNSPAKISGGQEKWFTCFLTATIRNAFLYSNYKIHWEEKKCFFFFYHFSYNMLWKWKSFPRGGKTS